MEKTLNRMLLEVLGPEYYIKRRKEFNLNIDVLFCKSGKWYILDQFVARITGATIRMEDEVLAKKIEEKIKEFKIILE